ncbi:hypothetical protein C0991_003623, partial [Blastosporella zonata]
HLAHYLLALWGLGADTDIINAAYECDVVNQKPSYESPEAITINNFDRFLGDERFYTAYRLFFTEAIQSKGVWNVLDEYVFDKSANFGTSGKGPEMLNRLLDGIAHPMIHAGYGVEFGLPGVVVEGLASAAIHNASASAILPPSLWTSRAPSTLESITSRLPSVLSLGSSTSRKNVHAFTILARILKDTRFDSINNESTIRIYTQVVEKHSDAINEYVGQWTYDSSNPEEVERKIEELVWTNEVLLRGYFAVSLAWWIGRGRADFDIAGFFADDTAFPHPAGPFPPLHERSLPSATSIKATTPNPWFPIIQTAVTIPDDHLPKLHRALAHFGSLYGTRAPGQPDFADTELPFAEKLDGSLFIRAAGLTNKRLLRPKLDVEGARFWDRRGFYKS